MLWVKKFTVHILYIMFVEFQNNFLEWIIVSCIISYIQKCIWSGRNDPMVSLLIFCFLFFQFLPTSIYGLPWIDSYIRWLFTSFPMLTGGAWTLSTVGSFLKDTMSTSLTAVSGSIPCLSPLDNLRYNSLNIPSLSYLPTPQAPRKVYSNLGELSSTRELAFAKSCVRESCVWFLGEALESAYDLFCLLFPLPPP